MSIESRIERLEREDQKRRGSGLYLAGIFAGVGLGVVLGQQIADAKHAERARERREAERRLRDQTMLAYVAHVAGADPHSLPEDAAAWSEAETRRSIGVALEEVSRGPTSS